LKEALATETRLENWSVKVKDLGQDLRKSLRLLRISPPAKD